MVNRLYNKQVSPKGYMKGGRIKKMGGGSANGNPISKSKDKGLAKMIESPKGREAARKMGFNPNRLTARKGGRA